MHCINCGTSLSENTKFCSSCGSSQSDDSQESQQPVGEDNGPLTRAPVVRFVVGAIIVAGLWGWIASFDKEGSGGLGMPLVFSSWLRSPGLVSIGDGRLRSPSEADSCCLCVFSLRPQFDMNSYSNGRSTMCGPQGNPNGQRFSTEWNRIKKENDKW